MSLLTRNGLFYSPGGECLNPEIQKSLLSVLCTWTGTIPLGDLLLAVHPWMAAGLTTLLEVTLKDQLQLWDPSKRTLPVRCPLQHHASLMVHLAPGLAQQPCLVLQTLPICTSSPVHKNIQQERKEKMPALSHCFLLWLVERTGRWQVLGDLFKLRLMFYLPSTWTAWTMVEQFCTQPCF